MPRTHHDPALVTYVRTSIMAARTMTSLIRAANCSVDFERSLVGVSMVGENGGLRLRVRREWRTRYSAQGHSRLQGSVSQSNIDIHTQVNYSQAAIIALGHSLALHEAQLRSFALISHTPS